VVLIQKFEALDKARGLEPVLLDNLKFVVVDELEQGDLLLVL
jgi:hypothetical protein